MRKLTTPAALVLATILTGCTSVNVQPVSQAEPLENIDHICIKRNLEADVPEVLPEIQGIFEDFNITTSVYRRTKPESCTYHLEYTAERSWDWNYFLSRSELHLYKDGKQISKGVYNVDGGFWSVDLSGKFAPIYKKMEPVIRQMLTGTA